MNPAWLSLLLLASPGPAVDVGITELKHCATTTLSFRTAEDGWLADHCGRIFRTSDGGHSWRRGEEPERALLGSSDHVQRWQWLSADTGLAFVWSGEATVFRTEDGGRAWTRVSTGVDSLQMVYAVESVGSQVWFCDSTGTIFRSGDAGRTWTQSERLFDTGMPDSKDWCAGISFRDATHGWAVGWQSLWTTQDGGRTWQRRGEIPDPAARAGEDPIALVLRGEDSRIDGVVVLDEQTGWVRRRNRTSGVTRDGGATWTWYSGADPRPQVALHHGRSLIIDGDPSLPSSQWRPLATDDYVLRGVQVASLAGSREALTFYDEGLPTLSWPIASPPSGERVTLAGQTGADALRLGWAEGGIFQQSQHGGRWFRIGQVPGVDRLAIVNQRRVLASAGGALRVSEDGGRSWRETTALDARVDWARLTGERGAVLGHEQPSCMLQGDARLEVTVGSRGCFHLSERTLLIEATGNRARLKLEPHRSDKVWDTSLSTGLAPAEFDALRIRFDLNAGDPLTRLDRRLTSEEGRALLARFVEASNRVEVPSPCSWTTTLTARLRWTCGSSLPAELEFETNDCDPRVGPVLRGAGGRSGPEPYARAAGVHAIGDELFDRYLPGR